MLRKLSCILFVISFAAAAADAGAAEVSPLRPVSTYSIVARDPDTGDFGVAVQSHWFSVGSLVPWARSGVGAVATQSLVDPSYGPLGLELMAAGKSATRSLDALLLADEHPEIRQVAMINARGEVAVHTGEGCIPEAGHRAGKGYSVQANLMDASTVPDAMAEAFEAAEGELAARMLAALEAAEGEGGDIRGRQSAALLVVRAESSGREWSDRLVDLHVEDHPQPLVELRRLYQMHLGYEQMNEGDLAIERNELETAEVAYGKAEELLPGNLEARFWHAVALVNADQLEKALPIFHEIFAVAENWRRLVPRLAQSGFLPDDAAVIEQIVSPTE